MPPELLFLDTSVHIARLLHGPAQRAKVEARAKKYLRTSGLVCRQEFKRRVLKTANYLLGVLDDRRGFANTHAYMTRQVQNKYQKRRATICLYLLAQATGNTDQDKTDRLRVRLRTFILTGLALFDGWLDRLARESGCGCGRENPRERELPRAKRKVIEFGSDECEQLAGRCGIVAFLTSRASERATIQSHLANVPDAKKTDELKDAEAFLAAIESNTAAATARNPCLTVGDLIIALESAAAGASAVYTMNGKESQHLCKSLGQTLIVRPPDEQKDDVICDRGDTANWPDFG